MLDPRVQKWTAYGSLFSSEKWSKIIKVLKPKGPSHYLKKGLKFGKLSVISHYFCRLLIIGSKNKEEKNQASN